MGYPELVRALEDEVERQARALADDGAREARRIVDDTIAEARRERERELERDERRRAELVARASTIERGEGERRAVAEMRRLLDALWTEAAARLPALGEGRLFEQLLDQLAAELDAGDAKVIVDPALVAAARARLPSSIGVEPGPPGALAASAAGGRVLLDNSPAARLRQAQPLLEAEVAALLFGGVDAAP